MRLPKKIEGFIGKVKTSVDTIGRVFTKICSADLRGFHWVNCYQLKRKKALATDYPLRKRCGIAEMRFKFLFFWDKFDIPLEKRPSGIAEQRYTMLYGKSQLKRGCKSTKKVLES